MKLEDKVLKALKSDLHETHLEPPAGYFDNLLSKVRDRIDEEQNKPTLWEKIVQLISVPTYAVAMSAIVIVITLSVSQLGELSILSKKNMYSRVSKQMTPQIADMYNNTRYEDEFIFEELNELDSGDVLIILKGLEA